MKGKIIAFLLGALAMYVGLYIWAGYQLVQLFSDL